MKRIIKWFSMVLFIFSIFSINAVAQGHGMQQNQQALISENIGGGVINDLSQDEIDGLLQMREEEKLARDVYSELFDQWNMQIFSNIASSEQTHTDAVKVLLESYGIDDPVNSDERGSFDDNDLKDLYVSLTAKGKGSLLDALIVGATIEDLDIKDLNELLEDTDNEDIILVYENLRKGSRNHLRAFNRQIENYGGTYEAQYLQQSEVDSIISGEQERGQIIDDNSSIISGFESRLQAGRAAGSGAQAGYQSGTEAQEQNQDNENQLQNRVQTQSNIQSGNYVTESGRRIQVEQSNNKVQLRSGSVTAQTSLEMIQKQTQSGTRLQLKLSNGENLELKVMPDTAVEKAMVNLNLQSCSEENGCEVELKEITKGNQVRAVYEVNVQKEAKILGLFKSKMQIKSEVDAETGEIIQTKKPWWAFLAS